MTPPELTRRGFVVGATALAASPALANAGTPSQRPADRRLLVVLHGDAVHPIDADPLMPGKGGWLNRLAAALSAGHGFPSLLVVGEKAPAIAAGPAPAAMLCREGLHLLAAPRLAALLAYAGPVRIAAASATGRPASRTMRLETWRRLGALLAEPAVPRLAVLDLARPDPPLDADLSALRAGLGGRAADMAVLVLRDGPLSSERADLPGRAVQTTATSPKALIRAVLRDHFGLADGVFDPLS